MPAAGNSDICYRFVIDGGTIWGLFEIVAGAKTCRQVHVAEIAAIGITQEIGSPDLRPLSLPVGDY